MAFSYKWSNIPTDATVTSNTAVKVLVDISDSAMPSSSFPDATRVYDQRIQNDLSISQITSNTFYGISGFTEYQIDVDNLDAAFNSDNFQGAYVRTQFVDSSGVVASYYGKVTEWSLGLTITLTVEDIDIEAFNFTLPSRTVNVTDYPNATQQALGKPIPIAFGRCVRLPLLNVNVDDLNREYDWLISEGTGLTNGLNDITNAYKEDALLDSIEGTADGGSSTTLILESADSRPDGWYKYFWVEITGGTGAGQIRYVTNYQGSMQTVEFANDTFTEGATTNLDAHTPETGGGWTLDFIWRWASSPLGVLQVNGANDDIRPSASIEFDDLMYVIDSNPLAADVEVEIQVKTEHTGDAATTLVARYDSSTKTGYGLVIGSDTAFSADTQNNIQIVRFDLDINSPNEGTHVKLATSSIGSPVADGDVWVFSVVGDTLKALRNGVEVLSVVDTTYTGRIGQVGILTGLVNSNFQGATTSTGFVDNFKARYYRSNYITVDSAWSTTPDNTSTYRLREWRAYDGTQGSPYSGLAFLRLKKSFSNNGTLPQLYADIDALQDEKNYVKAIRSILTNSTWGLNLTVDTSNFATAEALSAITAMSCEGAITEQRFAMDWLNKLLEVRDMTLTKGQSGLQISVDQAKTSQGTFGLGDTGGLNNIKNERPVITYLHPRERVKNYKVNYRKNYKEGNFMHEIERAANTNGIDQDNDLLFAYSHDTADRICDYKRKRLIGIATQINGLGVSDAVKGINKGESITIEIPSLGINTDYEIIGKRASDTVGDYVLDLVLYNDAYSYAASTLPTDETQSIPADTRFTIPDPVSNLAITHSYETVNQVTTAFVILTWDLPEDIAVEALVSFKKSTDGDTAWKEAGKGVNSYRIDGLIPGIEYDFKVEALNNTSSPPLKSSASTLSNELTGGDSTAPSTPTGLTAIKKFGLLSWEWNRLADATLSHYVIEVYTASSGGTLVHTEEILQPKNSSDKPRSSPFNAQTGSLTTNVTRYAQVKAVDYSGNESAFTSRVSNATNDIERLDIQSNATQGIGESSTTSTISLGATPTTIRSISYTTIGKKLFIHGTCVIRGVSGIGSTASLGIELKRGSTVLQKIWTSPLANGDEDTVTFAYADQPSAGTYTYSMEADGQPFTMQADDRAIMVTEKRNTS